jgi:hypothetical protein
LSHAVTKVRRAASLIEDPCLSVGSHSAAAFTVVFDHTSYTTTFPRACLACNGAAFTFTLIFFWHDARMKGCDNVQSSFVVRLTTLPVNQITYLLDDTEQGIGKELEEALIT